MESNSKEAKLDSLKGMSKGKDSKVLFRSLRERGEKVLLRVREKLRFSNLDNEWGMKG